MYELFNKYSVVVVRLTPSLPQRGRHPRGNPLDPLAKFSINLLAQRGSDEAPERPAKGVGGNTRKIQKTSLVNRWFELNVKKLFEMSEFIQPSRISTEPIDREFGLEESLVDCYRTLNTKNTKYRSFIRDPLRD
jgi:hypothetical protein